MNAWSPLPNARLIDWVIASVKANPEKWSGAEDAVLNATRDAGWTTAWIAARRSINNAARRSALDASWSTSQASAYDVILALVAYDDCDQYLSMSYEQLLTYAVLSERPQAVLLLSLKWVQEHLSESLAVTSAA